MIYEGAVIRRWVSPNHPGDPKLDDPAVDVQFRVEYVRDDATAPAPGSWTRELSEAHVYPRHLDADERAKQISPHCYARVLARETDLPPAAAQTSPASGYGLGLDAKSADAGASARGAGGRNPLIKTRDIPGAAGVVRDHGTDASAQRGGGGTAGAASAGKKKPTRSRLAALRLAAERVADREAGSRTFWYQKDQYA